MGVLACGLIVEDGWGFTIVTTPPPPTRRDEDSGSVVSVVSVLPMEPEVVPEVEPLLVDPSQLVYTFKALMLQ